MISAVDKLIEAKKQFEFSDVQDHMNDAVNDDFFNPSIAAALKRWARSCVNNPKLHWLMDEVNYKPFDN